MIRTTETDTGTSLYEILEVKSPEKRKETECVEGTEG